MNPISAPESSSNQAPSAAPLPPGLIRGSDDYESCRRRSIWQRVIPDRFPASIVHVTHASDVPAAIRVATAAGRRISVLSSGHSYIGNALQDDTVLLDLTALKRIQIDLDHDVARVEPAVTNGALESALASAGRAFPVGHSPSVAIGGYLLGGGLGWNPDGWGTAACQHVLAATVALASGEIVRTSPVDHPDLFFALRGAGPCFPGVVLEYEIRLLQRPRVITELAARYPITEMPSVLTWAEQALASKEPDVELSVMFIGAATSDGPTALASATAFSNDAAENLGLLDPLTRTLPRPPDVPLLRHRTLAEMMDENDAAPQRYAVDGAWSDDPVEALRRCAERFRSCPSADSLIHVSLRSDPGLPNGGAFSIAGSTFVFSSAVWSSPADDAANLAWQDALLADLEPVTSGYYVNEVDYIRHPQRLARCFTSAAGMRLRQVQDHYDPQHVFAAPNRPA